MISAYETSSSAVVGIGATSIGEELLSRRSSLALPLAGKGIAPSKLTSSPVGRILIPKTLSVALRSVSNATYRASPSTGWFLTSSKYSLTDRGMKSMKMLQR